MSFKGVVEARCPTGCAPFETDVWSVINAELDPELKERLLAGEINLLACATCEQVFYYEHPLVYMDPQREIMAFIYPAGYAKEEKRWRTMMAEDYEKLQAGLKERKLYQPDIYFGVDAFIEPMRREEDLYEEAEVAAFTAHEAGLDVFFASPSWSRKRDMPPILPLAKGKGPLRARLLEGLRTLVAVNDALARYNKLLGEMEKTPQAKWQDPPGRTGLKAKG